MKFLPNNAPVFKEMHKSKIIKVKDFIIIQNILFMNNCFKEERLKSFNTAFKQM